ncbi:hypothetical protein DL96DRAFT_1811622 [Flagelloscypha sp. PMI_526]|nr:hypothetical protein DL96DRAFT_1811622 [Flagelloscypha sp. PMI_526]
MTSESPELYTLNGQCHCGQIKFVARNVNLDTMGKCNCSTCNIVGKITTTHTKPDDVAILKDGKEIPINASNVGEFAADGLSDYIAFPDLFKKGEHEVHLTFCNKCGVHPFVICHMTPMGGHFVCVNIRCVDLKAIGKDIKDLTAPEKMNYCNGLGGTWATRKGEQWPGGAW